LLRRRDHSRDAAARILDFTSVAGQRPIGPGCESWRRPRSGIGNHTRSVTAPRRSFWAGMPPHLRHEGRGLAIRDDPLADVREVRGTARGRCKQSCDQRVGKL